MTIADTLSIRLVLFVSGLQFRIQVPVDILTGFQRSHDRLTRIALYTSRECSGLFLDTYMCLAGDTLVDYYLTYVADVRYG
jgi:hypothetical protein